MARWRGGVPLRILNDSDCISYPDRLVFVTLADCPNGIGNIAFRKELR